MAAPVWITRAGDLGVIPELVYYEFNLDAYQPGGGSLVYTLVAGELPQGLSLSSLGVITGIPGSVIAVASNEFTIRITNTSNQVTDRTFRISVAAVTPPTIVPATTDLGDFIAGSLVDIQLSTINSNENLTTAYRITSGALPAGLSLSVDGLIYGYLTPVASPDPDLQPGWDGSGWDFTEWDFNGVDTDKNYQFTVEATDGVNIDTQTYTIYVYSRSTASADTTVLTADTINITADISNFYSPILLTPAGSVGVVRQNTNFAFRFDAVDFDDDTLTYNLVSGALPAGLTLNSSTGWITGYVPYGSLGAVTYDFEVNVSKTVGGVVYPSATKNYSIKLLGQISDTIVWLSPSDLGVINNGAISDLSIQAYTPSGRQLLFSLDTLGALPAGLELLQDGSISGRPSFQIFPEDASSQTFTFTVTARDAGNYAYDTKTFTLTVLKRNDAPYENLYITLLPNRAQRDLYDSILFNSDIFPQEYIYRPNDPWWGRNSLRRSLFLSGLNPATAASYINAMTLNHYWKTLEFGEVRTAQALDAEGAVKYEVVYLELVDTGVNEQGLGPNIAFTWPTNTANISTVYTNSFPNMVQRVGDDIGYENRSILPRWMTSRQTTGTVLGFTRALVLAYTVPGRSAEVAYRVNQVRDSFSLIDFTIDRYEWDHILSEYYDISSAEFLPNTFVFGTGNINANTSSNVITGIATNIAGAGVITGNTVSTVITGVGTSFNTQFLIGKPIYVAGNSIGTVTSITNANVLTLGSPLTSNITNVSYETTGISTLFAEELHVGDVINAYVSNANITLGTVASITSNLEIILSNNALSNVANVQYTHTATDPYTTPSLGDTYLKFPRVNILV